MKKLVLLAVAGMLLFAVGAQASVWNQAYLSFKNMAGNPFPETWTFTVQANLVGPMMHVNKMQTNGRTGANGGMILVASGDTIVYNIQFDNTGSPDVDTATDVVITDTMAFDTVPGQTVQYMTNTAQPDSGNNMAGGLVTLLYFDGVSWIPATSSTIPGNAKGLRWYITKVIPGGPWGVSFTVKITTP